MAAVRWDDPLLATRCIDRVFTVVGRMRATEFTSRFATVPYARLVDGDCAVPTILLIGGPEDVEEAAQLRSQACDMLFKTARPRRALQAAIGSAVSLGQVG